MFCPEFPKFWIFWIFWEINLFQDREAFCHDLWNLAGGKITGKLSFTYLEEEHERQENLGGGGMRETKPVVEF